MKVAKLLGLSCACLLLGCVTVESISVSQIPEKDERKRKIVSEKSQPIIFLIPFGTSYVEEAHQDLLRKCPDGAIEGMVSKHAQTQYFGFLAASASLRLQGYCVTESSSKGRRRRRKT